MTPLRPRAEHVLAAASAAVGLIGVASALSPSLPGRAALVAAVLPPGFPGFARFAALTFALALIWLSGALLRRKRRAWSLACWLVVAVAVAHLAKGLDFEEAAASALLLAGLLHYRDRFDVPGDRRSARPLLLSGALIAVIGLLLARIELSEPGVERAHLEGMLGALAALLAAHAVYVWLRPVREGIVATREERRRALELVEAYGGDTLSFFALRRDKNYYFSATRDSMLAYRTIGGCALISGDPVGDPAEFENLVRRFRVHAAARGWRLAVLGAGGRLLPLYATLGLRPIPIGDEAVVGVAGFTLEGRPIRKVRQSVARLARAGYRLRVVAEPELTACDREALSRVSREWLGRAPERGFSMALDRLFGDPQTVFAIAEARDGSVGGFLHLVPCSSGTAYSLSAMRRRRDTPNGLMEFLVTETIAWARGQGVAELSLNFCVFGSFLRSDAFVGRVARTVLRPFDRFFQLERLMRFSGKFRPEWRPRYLLLERMSDLPAVGLSYLWIEALLLPPGPWTRRRPAVHV